MISLLYLECSPLAEEIENFPLEILAETNVLGQVAGSLVSSSALGKIIINDLFYLCVGLPCPFHIGCPDRVMQDIKQSIFYLDIQ